MAQKERECYASGRSHGHCGIGSLPEPTLLFFGIRVTFLFKPEQLKFSLNKKAHYGIDHSG